MNLYVHFPFCRSKCRYCALYSRIGVAVEDRDAYVRSLATRLRGEISPNPSDGMGFFSRPRGEISPNPSDGMGFFSRPWGEISPNPSDGFSTIYFGGGSPALCELGPIFAALAPRLTSETEFTVELHPLDVTDDLLLRLRDGGVNRISMGVQSLDDATLAAMGRGYSADAAARAFARVKRVFDNAGIDLIVGYPGDPCVGFGRLGSWGLRHCSVYSLQNERGLPDVPDDDWVLDKIRQVASALASLGLERYEISNYAVRGFECRHNLAVWRGEDYVGLGEGAFGRVGRTRTRNLGVSPLFEEISAERDALERRIFRLRTREGLDAAGRPEWEQTLAAHVENGLLTREGDVYRLTARGTEVCDAILADLV